ncbi:MAG: hypothetical protein CM1200mP14_26130 [Gammaproteobacteria bacterium]|nr:MAG: hypothetical protein CM1200mP14_26130 [Gammaproteobacteria bacterium]
MENAGLKVRILAMALIVPLALTACGDATGVEEDHGKRSRAFRFGSAVR